MGMSGPESTNWNVAKLQEMDRRQVDDRSKEGKSMEQMVGASLSSHSSAVNRMSEQMEMTKNTARRALRARQSARYSPEDDLQLDPQLLESRRKCCAAEYEKGKTSVVNLRRMFPSKPSSLCVKNTNTGNTVDMARRMLLMVPLRRVSGGLSLFSWCLLVVCSFWTFRIPRMVSIGG
ncbi:hypothetical protein M970_110060 [Encephalitozoon cuniculi EcunIII-L]|uniref:Uncharacterized protein n=1 Tax=Encephalitozoon cuniculi TaxID=6035 RepID=M1KB79_ENCCN|nr:hypothetical protein ECU11_0110 [Encephalitozoon cuniculi]KMV64968.1 hypothetical protein M970_110060 [Encephalitozoon cuniculi EcunIII-L]